MREIDWNAWALGTLTEGLVPGLHGEFAAHIFLILHVDCSWVT